MTIQRPPENSDRNVGIISESKIGIKDIYNSITGYLSKLTGGSNDNNNNNNNDNAQATDDNNDQTGDNNTDTSAQDGTSTDSEDTDEYYGVDKESDKDADAAEQYTTYGAAGIYDGYTNDKLVDKDNIWNTDGTLKDNPLASQDVLGLPFRYNNNADPAGRVFAQTIFQDIPIVYFIPGKPALNKKIISDSGKTINLNEYYKKVNENEGISWGVKPGLFSNSDDLKYVSFKANYAEYYKYVQMLTSTVYGAFLANGEEGLKLNLFDFSSTFKNKWMNYGIPFYMDKSSSISEDVSNTYGTSSIAEAVNDASSQTREVAMLGDSGGFTSITQSIAKNLKALAQGIGDSFKAAASYDYILTKTSNKLVRIVNGSQLDFPEVWQDSKFDRNYNLTFKFFSPYGDKKSVFKYVICPFLSLLALTLPRQDHVLSYVEPFLVRVVSPGNFAIDMGVITSMSIMKGGSENLWTMDGLPRAIDVTVSIQDLYPSMNQVRSGKMMRYNKSLSMYLETLAGVRTDIINSFTGELKSWLSRKLSAGMTDDIITGIKNHVGDMVYNTQTSIKDIFR